MTATTSASPATAPDASIATPAHQPRNGPLRSGNPRGNPNLAPRCGARARTTGCPCRAPAIPNGRCRMHGGKSTGPRTPAGFASLTRARTTHGKYAQAGPQADERALIHHARVFNRRTRLKCSAFDVLPWLPPAFAARLRADTATELDAPALGAKLQAVLTAGVSKPADLPPAAATPPPPGDTPHPRRDASGRFASPPPCLLRGRQAERAQARTEATALAPWRQAIAHARTAMRQAHTAQNDKPRTYPPAPGAEKPAPARPLPQTARFANLRIHPMNPETEPPCPTSPGQPARFEKSRINPVQPTPALPPATPAEPADASSAKTAMQRGTVAPPAGPAAAAGEPSAQHARFEKSRTNSGQPATALPPATPAEAAAPSSAKTSIQRGAVALPAIPGAAAGEASAKTSIQRGARDRTATSPATPTAPTPPDLRNPAPPAATQPACEPLGNHPPYRGTVAAGANPFRNALLAGTVGNTPDAHRLATTVQRAGGWPIIIASDAAKQAGKDWRPAATAARQRLADEANRQRTDCILRPGPRADPVRTDWPPNGLSRGAP
jgi:hypothetical protein